MCFFTNGFSPLKNCLFYKQSLNVIYVHVQTFVHVLNWSFIIIIDFLFINFENCWYFFTMHLSLNASENVGKIKTPLCLPWMRWLSIDRISIIRMVDTMHSAGPMVRSANSQQPLKNKKIPRQTQFINDNCTPIFAFKTRVIKIYGKLSVYSLVADGGCNNRLALKSGKKEKKTRRKNNREFNTMKLTKYN